VTSSVFPLSPAGVAPMKIIVLQDYLRSGGTERHSILLARELSGLGHAATLLTFRPGHALRDGGRGHAALQPFDTGIDWLARASPARSSGSPRHRPLHGKTANCFAAASRAAPPHAGCRPGGRDAPGGGRLPWFYYRSVRKAAHWSPTASRRPTSSWSLHGLERARVSVIPNSLVFAEVSQGATGPARAPRAGPGTTVLLSVGMFRPEKNQRTSSGSPPPAAGWTGSSGSPATGRAARCERLAQSQGLGRRVRFVGFQPDRPRSTARPTSPSTPRGEPSRTS